MDQITECNVRGVTRSIFQLIFLDLMPHNFAVLTDSHGSYQCHFQMQQAAVFSDLKV